MKIKRGNLLTVLLAMLCVALIALGVGFALPKNETKTARAAGGELIKSDGSKYDSDELDALAVAAGYTDINAMLDALDGGTVLQASNFGNYEVTIGGKDWWPVYASGSTLTLWLKNSLGQYTWADGSYSAGASNPRSNNYGTSWIHATINAGQTSLGYYYGNFASDHVGITCTQYANNVKSPAATMAPTAFTSLVDFAAGGLYSSFILPAGTLTFGSLLNDTASASTSSGYTSAWVNDNLFLPSAQEAKSGGVWGTTSIQLSSGGTDVWLRSGIVITNSLRAYLLTTSGSASGYGVVGPAGVRPAIHLDLSTARRASVKDVEATYTGSTLSIADVAADKKEWYDSTLMDLTYPTANATDMIDADTYVVKAELTATAVAANYIFRGDADPSKGAGDESDTIRYFNFKINPKKLTIPKVTNSPQTYDPVNGSHFAVNSDFDAATMKGAGVTTGITWNSATNCFDAIAAGTYSVKFQLKDTQNYIWDKGVSGTTDDQPATVKVDPIKLTIPTITAPQEYTGSALQFVLADFNAGTYIKVDSATGTGSNTVTGAGGATITDTTDTFEATKVGKYTVKLSLRDTKNYAWSDGVNTAKNVEFEITQKELLSTPPVSSEVNGTNGAEWKFGDTVTITITDDRVTGENISLLCYYDVVGGTSKANTLTATTTGNVTTLTLPTNIAVGKYTLTVELNGNTGDNANYKLTKNNTLDFEVTSGKIDPSTYGWIYTIDGAAGSTIADGDKLLFTLKTGSATDGVKYELSIQIPTTDASKVQVDTTKYVNGYQTRSGDSVNTYKTIVALKSVDPDFKFEVNSVMQSTCEVEFNWEIEKGTFDLTNVKWEYSLTGNAPWTEYDPSNPPQYNDGYDITVRVKASTLPTGLTLDSLYTGVEESDVDNYTATISLSDLKYNSSNFNDPDVSKLNLNWEIAKKNLFNGFKNVKDTYSNGNGSGSFIIKQLDVPTGFESYIKYEYYEKSSGSPVSLQDIKDAADPTNEKTYVVKAYIDPAYASNYDVDDNGSTPSDEFTTGSKNKLATATIDGADGTLPISAVYDGNTHFDSSLVKITSDTDGLDVSDFTVKYYKGTKPVAGNELPAGELPEDAGEYCVEIILGTQAAKKYILAKEIFTVTVEAKGIDLPVLGTITFNGKEQNFTDNLSGASWTTYGPAGKDIIKVDGKLSDRNVGAGNYVTTLELTDSNYKWIYPSSVSPTKAIVKYSLAADGVKVTGDDTTATYNWNLTPLIVDTTNMWNKGKNGATLNLPQNIRDLIAGGTLDVGYRYYDSEGVFVEEPELKGGRSFKVEAVFTGDDAERNVQFKRSETDFGSISKSIDYTVPQTGAAAFFGKVKDALSNTWLGLPIWAWLLIALALIILLIVIIAVCVKRRKTKEEREAKKAAKEEEKQRREEEREAERQRREDERRMQQEKLEAERELARAKQEAELEKIRAQSQAAATAGMATMAVQQQPQPQPVQPPVQQPVQQMQQYPQPQMQQMAMPSYGAPMQSDFVKMFYESEIFRLRQELQSRGGGSAPSNYEDARLVLAEERARTAESRLAEERARAAEEKSYRSMEERAMLAEERYVRGGGLPAPANQNVQSPALFNGDMNPDFIGAVIASALRNSGIAPAALTTAQNTDEPQTVEEKTVPATPTMYPSDAVITTTTTVDTTKSKPITRSRDEEANFDVDGFYDTFE